MKAYDLVTHASNHPANAVFQVVNRTGNGWLHCRVYSDQSGPPVKRRPDDAIFRFRVSEMRPWLQTSVPPPSPRVSVVIDWRELGYPRLRQSETRVCKVCPAAEAVRTARELIATLRREVAGLWAVRGYFYPMPN